MTAANPDLVAAQRRRALADVEAALHHLQVADEAIQRALGRIPVPELFADDVTGDDLLTRSWLRAARIRVRNAQMFTRKAREVNV